MAGFVVGAISGATIPAHVSTAFASPDLAAIRQELFIKVNAERVRENLPPLAVNLLLSEAAQQKAEDMMTGLYFEHTSPAGRAFYEWIDAMGYLYTIAGENLAANTNTISTEKMVDAWMGSSLHRANILSPEFTETGLGVVRGRYEGKDAVFAVQIFAHPAPRIQSGAAPEPAPPSKFLEKNKPEPSAKKSGLVAGAAVIAALPPAPLVPNSPFLKPSRWLSGALRTELVELP